MSEKRDNNDSTVNNGKPAAWKLDKPADHIKGNSLKNEMSTKFTHIIHEH